MFAKTLFAAGLLLLTTVSGCTASPSSNTSPITEVDGVIWGIAQVSEHNLLITTRDGRLFRVDTRQAAPNNTEEISGLPPVWHQGQGGLMDVALSPDGHWLYFTYSKPTKGGASTTLARASWRSDQQQLENWQDLLVTQPSSDVARHFGSRIAFDEQGHVFFGVGDRGHRPNGQDLSTHSGSILRLNLDGSIPNDNPFVNQPGAKPEIWSYGHRNPQGLCFDKQRSQLWESEHGPRGGDEVNLIAKGANYGWAEVSYGKEYVSFAAVGEATERDDVAPPRQVYIPSIAPGSLLCSFEGKLLLGALKLTHLNRLTIDQDNQLTDEQRYLEDSNLRIRSLLRSDSGSLLLGTDDGRLLEVNVSQLNDF